MALPPGERTVPLAEAAERLGLSTEAVRKRLERGTLSGVKQGRAWFVILPDEASGQRPDERPDGDGETLHVLRSQLETKDEQIRRQQDEIERLTVMLADAQGTIRGLLPARTQNAPESPERRDNDFEHERVTENPKTAQRVTGEESAPSPKRRGWLARLFRLE